MGLESKIFAIAVADDVQVEVVNYLQYRRRVRSRASRTDGPVLLYQASTGSPVGDWLRKRSEPIVINYHNITPASDFEAWDVQIAREMDKGRQELEAFARRAVHAIADSEYNRAELVEVGYESTSVAPILFDPDAFDRPPDPSTLKWIHRSGAQPGANVLFVGRVVPNKAQHDLIEAFSLYRDLFDPGARLFIVGGCPVPDYQRALRSLALKLGVHKQVHFAGFVSQAELSAFYSCADIFVCLSDHEGFCVPLLEAMFHRIPVVAFDAAAVPETLGDGGLLLGSKDPLTVACAMNRVVSDERLAKDLVMAGEARLASFSLERSRKAFREGIERALAALEA